MSRKIRAGTKVKFRGITVPIWFTGRPGKVGYLPPLGWVDVVKKETIDGGYELRDWFTGFFGGRQLEIYDDELEIIRD